MNIGGGELGKNELKVVKRYKLPVIIYKSSGDIMYSMVTIVNNTVFRVSYLKIAKIVIIKSSYHKKKNCNYVR